MTDQVTTTVEFRLQLNLIVIPVTVNEFATEFVVDTGAAATVISTQLAERLGLTQGRRFMGSGAGGDVVAAAGQLDRLKVGSIEMTQTPCTVLNLARLSERLGGNVEGVLGFDFFGRGTVEIDYPNRRFKVTRPAQQKRPEVRLEDRRLLLDDPELSIDLPDAWTPDLSPEEPGIAALVHSPKGRLTLRVQLIEAHGIGIQQAIIGLKASLPAQVADYRETSLEERSRARHPTVRIEYHGTPDAPGKPAVRKRYVTEAVIVPGGMLVLTMEGATPWPADLESSVDGIFESLDTAPVAT